MVGDRGQVGRLGEHVDAGEKVWISLARILVQHANPASLRENEAAEQFEQGRLARSIESEHTIDMSRSQREVQVVEDNMVPVTELDVFQCNHGAYAESEWQ